MATVNLYMKDGKYRAKCSEHGWLGGGVPTKKEVVVIANKHNDKLHDGMANMTASGINYVDENGKGRQR
jgi:hypothetical protein